MGPRCSLRLALAPVLALAALSFGAPVAISAPTFGAPIDVAPADQQAAEPTAAYGEGGVLDIGWWTSSGEETSVLATVRRPLAGVFASGPALANSEELVDGPKFAAAPNSQIIAAWALDGTIFASRLGTGGEALGAVQVSATDDDSSDPAIAIGGDGRVAIAWTVTDGDDNGEVRAVHGALGTTTRRVVSVGETDAAEPAVAFDSLGNLQVAFTRIADEGNRIKVAAAAPPGPFAPSRFVSPADVSASGGSIAPAPGGGLAIAWSEETELTSTVKVGVETAPGLPFDSFDVPGGGASSSAHLAVDPATSTLTVAWLRVLSPGARSVLVATRMAVGPIGAPQVVSGTDNVTAFDLAYSSAGDAALTWRRNLGPELSDIRAALFEVPRTPAPDPGPSPTLPGPSRPLVALPELTLRNFGVDPQCIRYGALQGTRKRLSFGFVLSDAASVRLTIQRRLNSGPLRRCPSRRVPGEAGRLGSAVLVNITSGAGAGGVSVGDEGEAVGPRERGQRTRLMLGLRLRSGRWRIVLRQSPTTFAPGTYVATAMATTADGLQSAVLQVKFWVLRRSKRR